LSKKFIFLPDTKNKKNQINVEINKSVSHNSVITELIKRRNKHLEFIKIYRKESAEEWFELWPSSMNRNIPNIYANRRLFKSYEPFMSNEIVKISASIPQKWKLNRSLFQKVAKPYLKKSKWIFHGDGWLPYFSYRVNSILSFFTWTYRQFGRRFGFVKGNQGPWAEWKTVIRSKEWEQVKNNYYESISLKKVIDLLSNNKLTTLQSIALTQILYQIQR